MKNIDTMQPISSLEIPRSDDGFVYEVKYDGFRATLFWGKDNVQLTSRNQKDLTTHFPEIIYFCQTIQASMDPFLPLQLDGEIVILNNYYQANFNLIQKRGRMKLTKKIEAAAQKRPATFLAFDLLSLQGHDWRQHIYQERKDQLSHIFSQIDNNQAIRLIPSYTDAEKIRSLVFDYKGEGIVAKRLNSLYHPGKDHHDWFKIKNWRTIQGIVTSFDPKNGYFTIEASTDSGFQMVGKCKNSLDNQALKILHNFFMNQGKRQSDGRFILPPAICVQIYTLDLHDGELREPMFVQILENEIVGDCTIEKINLDCALLPPTVDITNSHKIFWPKRQFTKGDLLIYIREVAPYMLHFLTDRALTIIRCPDGVHQEAFFQKKLPTYAPEFIKNNQITDNESIICYDLASLIWLANHGTIEYHIPFQTIHSTNPVEIVFDLDPPDSESFTLAVHGALLIKEILDELKLKSFIKTSGNKGLQIYIPIPQGSMTYAETGIFTEAIALTVVHAHPQMFTIERLKKHRNGRLYIDYLQHGKDKTIIAPYSPRKTSLATVATPLFWEEVKLGLDPTTFTIKNVVERVQLYGCPFTDYQAVGKQQKVAHILQLLQK